MKRTIFLLFLLNLQVNNLFTENPTPQIRVKTLKRTTNHYKREFPAQIRANTASRLSFRIDGPLHILNCHPGTSFEKGDVLAILDPRDFILRMERIRAGIEEAKATLKAMLSGARAEDINALNSRLDGAISQMKEAEANHERITGLYKQGVATKAQQENAQTTFEVTKAQVSALREEMQKALSGARAEEVEAMNARIRGLEAEFEAARNALHDSRLIAPFKGVVAERYVENHEIIKAGQPILLFLDLSAIRVRTSLPEEIIINQKQLKKAEVRFPGLNNQTFISTKLEFSQTPSPANLIWLLDVIMEVPADSPLIPGMSAFITIKQESENPVFIVPHQSIYSPDLKTSQAFVFEPSCQCARLREVKTGFLRSEGVEVTAGLNEGELLITAGDSELYDGQIVRIKE